MFAWFSLFFFCFMASLQAKPLDLSVKARSAILINGETGAILFEKEAHTQWYPASTTKVATLLYILDREPFDFDKVVTASAEALRIRPDKNDTDTPAYWDASDGTKMGLVRGEKVTLDMLLHGLILPSGNDAANVLAEAFAPTIPDFIQKMNQYLVSLGCKNTQFLNPHGYHHPEHFTTAYDLSLITKKALQIPKFRQIVSTLSYTKAKTNKQPETKMRLFNHLMTPGKFFYPKAIGVKTGYHSNGGCNLVAAAEHEGRTLIAVIFGCENREDRYRDATRLFETAFAEKKEKKRLFTQKHLFVKELAGAKSPLKASLENELAVEFYPAEEPACKAFVYWETLEMPIRKGQKVGEVRIFNEAEHLLQKKDLLAQEEVQATLLFKVQKFFRRLVS